MRETEEFLAHANIFRGLRVGQCVLLQRTPKRIELINVRFQKEVTEALPEKKEASATSVF